MKFDKFFLNFVDTIEFLLKSEDDNWHYTWKATCDSVRVSSVTS
jgi:hypothetical protein